MTLGTHIDLIELDNFHTASQHLPNRKSAMQGFLKSTYSEFFKTPPNLVNMISRL